MMCPHDDNSSFISETDLVAFTLDCELVKHVLKLSSETRAKLLALLHLVEEPSHVRGDLHVSSEGHVYLKLFGQAGSQEGFQPDPGSSAEPLQ
jgi:hypothetical protein